MEDRAKILLVDDEARNLDALEAILESPDHDLIRASSADQALLALLHEEFAAIVLDIRMPGVSGIELAQIIKRRKRSEHVPILFLTAHPLEERDVIRGYGAGAVDYLSKPVNPAILCSKVAVFVDLFRKTRQLASVNQSLQLEIAQRQKAQEALRVANDELESRVRERTHDLIAVNRCLAESEERLRQALSAAEMGSWRVDVDTGVCSRDASLNRILGLTPVASVRPIAELFQSVAPEDLDQVMTSWRRALEAQSAYAAEFRIRRPDGSVRWVRDHGCSIPGESGARCITGVTIDITERREAEEALIEYSKGLDAAIVERTQALERSHERLRQAERLATIGTLAAGLGHDMSNLLFPIRARLSTLADADLPEAAAADVAAIREASGYLQRLASGLRLLAADPDRETESPGGIDIANWWRDAEGVFRAALPRGIRVEGELPAGLPPVAISSSQLTQAVFNLVQNAGEAIAGTESSGITGLIRVRASLVSASAGSDGGSAVVELTVSDDGPGMSAEVAARCFEPYFSTKVRAISTGMGLSMVRRWIEAAGGEVLLDSALGRGTTFTLRLLPARSYVPQSTPSKSATELRAAMTIDNRRMDGLIGAMVASAGLSLIEGSSQNIPDAEIWIIDAGAARLERIISFLAQGPNRRAILLSEPYLGPAPAGAGDGTNNSPSPAELLLGTRIRYLGRQPTMGELRDALVQTMRGIQTSNGPLLTLA